MIDQLFEHGCIEVLLAHQIDQNTRIKIATPRAHDHPAGWGQSHTGIDRSAGFDRRHTSALAKMSDDETVRQVTSELAHDRFARKTVKSVSLNSFRLQFLGDRKDTRNLRQRIVKSGVETSHLRKPRKML